MIVVALVDSLISFFVFVLVMWWYRFFPGWKVTLLPAFLTLAILATAGPALWATALNVKYRDFRYLIPLLYSSVSICRQSALVLARFRPVASALLTQSDGWCD